MAEADFRYVVEGSYPFPADMLRRDGSNAASPRDQAWIDRLSQDLPSFVEEDATPKERRAARSEKVRIALVIPNASPLARPLYDRWESFGWSVVETSDPDALKIQRAYKDDADRRRKDGAIIAGAIAKLTTEERNALARNPEVLGTAGTA